MSGQPEQNYGEALRNWGPPVIVDPLSNPNLTPAGGKGVFVTPDTAANLGIDPASVPENGRWFVQDSQPTPAQGETVVTNHDTRVTHLPDGMIIEVTDETTQTTTRRQRAEIRGGHPISQAHAAQAALGLLGNRPPTETPHYPAERVQDSRPPVKSPRRQQAIAAAPASAPPQPPTGTEQQGQEQPQGQRPPVPELANHRVQPFYLRHFGKFAVAALLLGPPTAWVAGYHAQTNELPGVGTVIKSGLIHTPDVIGDAFGATGAVVGFVKGIAP